MAGVQRLYSELQTTYSLLEISVGVLRYLNQLDCLLPVVAVAAVAAAVVAAGTTPDLEDLPSAAASTTFAAEYKDLAAPVVHL